MKITKGIISREQALALAPAYVAFSEGKFYTNMATGESDGFKTVLDAFDNLKKGQNAITFIEGKFVQVKVSSVRRCDWRAVDGPVVRVTNGEFSWRVDGCGYAYPV